MPQQARRTAPVVWALIALLLVGCWTVPAAAAATRRATTAKRTRVITPPRLVWHLEDEAGDVVASSCSDEPINPASVVKVATTLVALERLGPRYRFATRFAVRGLWDRSTGIVAGDLIVMGGGDPDFHAENAFLVAEQLNAMGLKRVQGKLLVSDTFWMGWEGGSERRQKDPLRRAETMAWRLREALDPLRWTAGTRRTWTTFKARSARGAASAPAVVVAGGVGLHDGSPPDQVLLYHRSNPLQQILRRLNVHSNNDIERLEASVGSPAEVAASLALRWNLPASAVRLETLSGLGTNRMSPRMIVRLLHDLRTTCERLGIGVEDVLPVAGCGSSTLTSYPGLRQSSASRAMVAKTGTLTQTDGGVAVLAGVLQTAQGDRVFCTAAPRTGSGIWAARQGEVRWVLEQLGAGGGPRQLECPGPVGLSYDEAAVTER